MSLIRVLEIPKSDGKFCFGGGNFQNWKEVDWFRDDDRYSPKCNTENQPLYEEQIKSKNYFDPAKAYLVLHQDHTFTIGYHAP